MTGTPPSEERTLLVPMHLDALVINKKIRKLPITYNRWQMGYSKLKQFEKPAPGEFVNQTQVPPPDGVHLHWALPDGLTHGVENEEGQIEFPFVPNRWLVVRLQPGNGSVNAWVLVSDELGDHCTSPFIDPHKSQPGNVIPTRLGARKTIHEWDEMMGEYGVTPAAPFLRAVGPGNVAFAAFAPGVENVFAFHDDVSALEATELTYLVMGWYSQPEKMDPLHSLPIDARRCEFLFNISYQFQKELEKGSVSEIWRQVFGDHGIDLPDEFVVLSDQSGSEWQISLGNKTYKARRENDNINVYDCTVAWRNEYLFNVSSRFQVELDEKDLGILPQVFKDHGIDLPDKSEVSSDQPGSEWLIKGGNRTYTARRENDNINIYDCTLTVADDLHWAVKLDGQPPPTRTLVHGLVYGVEWNLEGYPKKPINVPGVLNKQDDISRGVRVAVGNTSIDALAALIRCQMEHTGQGGQGGAEWMEAFQYNLLSTLNQVGGKTLLDQQIRQTWFGSNPGGIRWTIVAQEGADDPIDQKPPKISSDQAAWLAELNKKQRALDSERRLLASMQWELYALWWKSKRIEKVDPGQYIQAGSDRTKTPRPRPVEGSNTATPPSEGDDAGQPASQLVQIIQLIIQLFEWVFGRKSKDAEPTIPEPPEDRDESERDHTPLARTLARQLDLNDPDSFANQVKAQQDKVAQLARGVPLATGEKREESIAAYAQEQLDPDELLLKPTGMPRFWHPNDPVILISGLGLPPKHGHAGTLQCRLASQTIEKLTVGSATLTADELEPAIPRLTSDHLPPVVSRLLTEAFFLDPSNATTMARVGMEAIALAGLQIPDSTDALEKAIKNQTSDTKARQSARPGGPRDPKEIGKYGALEWEQPWSPLFLDWQVGFHYTFEQEPGGSFKIQNDGNFVFAREPWHFDGTDAGWTGPGLSAQHRRSYGGRTFLTPHASLTFMDRLHTYLQSHPNPNLQAAEALLEKISQWEILSQTMSGFTYQLALRDLEYNVPPVGPIADLVGHQHYSVPLMSIVPDPGKGIPFFFPLRAGFFEFEALRVIDKFGRTLDLMRANNNPSGSEKDFSPIRGRGMVPGSGNNLRSGQRKRFVKLPPRLVQSCRLSIRFVSATDDQQETGLAADSNPVCGWLLPNHLDKSISVYDADGNLLGELLLLRKSKEERIVNWQAAPGAPDLSPAGNTLDEVRIANPHLKNMIEALMRRNDQGAAFGNLMQVIDETLWTIDPLGQRDDQNLSVLIGRPLALVRANLQLELNGKPFCNQAWHETFGEGSSRLTENSGGLLDLDFPIRLGSQDLRNDGLIGYFQGTDNQKTDYAHFYTEHLPGAFMPANPAYIQQLSTDDYVRLKPKATTPAPFDPAGSAYLTMLIDPRGVIHATSGLLPPKVVELPERYVSEPLKRMAITFRAGPLLLDPETIRLPLAAEQHGDWTWIQATSTKKGDWTTAPIVEADAKARLSTKPLTLVEGWLKFSPDKIEE